MQPFWWHSRLYPDPGAHNAGESQFQLFDKFILSSSPRIQWHHLDVHQRRLCFDAGSCFTVARPGLTPVASHAPRHSSMDPQLYRRTLTLYRPSTTPVPHTSSLTWTPVPYSSLTCPSTAFLDQPLVHCIVYNLHCPFATNVPVNSNSSCWPWPTNFTKILMWHMVLLPGVTCSSNVTPQ